MIMYKHQQPFIDFVLTNKDSIRYTVHIFTDLTGMSQITYNQKNMQ